MFLELTNCRRRRAQFQTLPETAEEVWLNLDDMILKGGNEGVKNEMVSIRRHGMMAGRCGYFWLSIREQIHKNVADFSLTKVYHQLQSGKGYILESLESEFAEPVMWKMSEKER